MLIGLTVNGTFVNEQRRSRLDRANATTDSGLGRESVTTDGRTNARKNNVALAHPYYENYVASLVEFRHWLRRR